MIMIPVAPSAEEVHFHVIHRRFTDVFFRCYICQRQRRDPIEEDTGVLLKEPRTCAHGKNHRLPILQLDLLLKFGSISTFYLHGNHETQSLVLSITDANSR